MRKALLLACGILVAAACGTRTGLLTDGFEDTPSDAGADAPTPPRDAGLDALPPIDASRRDAQPPPSDCPDAGATLIYVITRADELFSFYPPTNGFRMIGKLRCPGTTSHPLSMAVSRKSLAYTVYDDGHVFRVSTATAECTATPYVPGQLGFLTFGMGYVADINGPDETLFVAESNALDRTTTSKGLAFIDTKNFALHFVAPFTPPIVQHAELTGTGDARLFAFIPNATQQGSHIAEVDRTSGKLVGIDAIRAGGPDSAYAFAFWGGDFYTFTFPATGTLTHVTRFRPSDKSEVEVTTLPAEVVGAGVSTCAPQ